MAKKKISENKPKKRNYNKRKIENIEENTINLSNENEDLDIESSSQENEDLDIELSSQENEDLDIESLSQENEDRELLSKTEIKENINNLSDKLEDTEVLSDKLEDTEVLSEKLEDTEVLSEKLEDTEVLSEKPEDTEVLSDKPEDTEILSDKPEDTINLSNLNRDKELFSGEQSSKENIELLYETEIKENINNSDELDEEKFIKIIKLRNNYSYSTMNFIDDDEYFTNKLIENDLDLNDESEFFTNKLIENDLDLNNESEFFTEKNYNDSESLSLFSETIVKENTMNLSKQSEDKEPFSEALAKENTMNLSKQSEDKELFSEALAKENTMNLSKQSEDKELFSETIVKENTNRLIENNLDLNNKPERFTNKLIENDLDLNNEEYYFINDYGINNIINNQIDIISENKYTLDNNEIEHILKEDSITPDKINIDLSIISKVIDEKENNSIESQVKEKTKYTLNDLKKIFNNFNEAILLIQIINGNIKYIEKKGYESRNQSVIDLLIKANNYQKLPDIQFLIFTNDFIDNNLLNKCPFLFTFCKKYSYQTQLFPNFNFNHWLEAGIDNYENIYNYFNDNIIEWNNKKESIFWTGNIKTNSIRKKIHKASKDYDLFFINSIDNNKTNIIPITEINKYKYLLNMNGNSYGGRLNYLFMSSSCVIILKNNDKEKIYDEYFYNYFISGEDYIEIKYNDNEDGNIIIDRILNEIKNNDTEQIARRCYNKARVIFEMNNVYKYINQSLLKLSNNCDIINKIESTTTFIPKLNNYLKNRINVNNNSIQFNYQGSDIDIMLYSDEDHKLKLIINGDNTKIFLNSELIIDKFTPFILNPNKQHNYLIKIEESNLSLIIENKFRLLNVDIKENFKFNNCDIMSINGGLLLL
jgi:hypothetical protein